MDSLLGENEPQGWLSYSVFAVAGLLIYASICSVFRFRRVTDLRAKYGFNDRISLRCMTNEQAHHIVKQLAAYESPICFDLALRIALFRVFYHRRKRESTRTARR